MEEQHDAIERTIVGARPDRAVDEGVRVELNLLVSASRRAASRADGTRRHATVATLAVLGVAVFGGVGAAAAATVDSWAWWQSDSDRVLTYALPTGTTCEHYLGQVESADEEVRSAARDVLATVDFEARIDLQAEYDRVLADATRYANDPSAQSGGPYEIPPAVEIYQSAMFQAITGILTMELEARGFDSTRQGNAGMSLSGHTECSPSK